MPWHLLKPSTLGVAILLAILVVQVGLIRRHRVLLACWGPATIRTEWDRVGFPVVAEVTVRDRAGEPTVETRRFFWPSAVAMLAGTYCVAMPLGRRFTPSDMR